MISPWRPTVAKLPDLTQMLIKTYVNEIDISKVSKGQNVEIGVDAFAGKTLNGEVSSVANIGEQMKNSTAHVFEVSILVYGQDDDLRPAMTTKNTIITSIIPDAIFIPLECLNTQDSIQFVYHKGKKQQVITAESNQESIIIKQGLSKDDELYLFPPEGAENWNLKLLTKDTSSE